MSDIGVIHKTHFIDYAICCSRLERTGSVKECPDGLQKPLSLDRTL